MDYKDSLIALRDAASSVAVTENLDGLKWMKKVFNSAGTEAAFLSESKLDLDTDGVTDPNIKYDPDHQGQTSIDGSADWLDANTLNYFVLPIGFTGRHGGIRLGCLASIVYGDRIAHAIFADSGPTDKFGEASINVHRSLGFERVVDSKIVNVGIDNDVWILVFIGSHIATPCTQDEIDAAAHPLWEAMTS
ncbi:MAG: glycoside hydrolase family 75 protein [Fimbriimonas sp.]|nr:glycoside hydrolase family 75 protein [Fimbriimonas sp.]